MELVHTRIGVDEKEKDLEYSERSRMHFADFSLKFL